MRTDRISARTWLAALLVGSAVLFFIGIYIERGATASSTAATTASGQASASPPAEGGAGEAGEARHSTAASVSGEAASGETAAQRNAEWRPFGIDLESPLFVDAAIVTSLVLAVAVFALTIRLVPLAIVGFALVFAFFDVLEVVHQVSVAQTNLAVIAIVLLVIHLTAGLFAVRLLSRLLRRLSSFRQS